PRKLMEVRGTLRCPSCGHGNRPDRRFCTECGSRLGRTCAACGRALESSEKFCGNCGAAVTGASALAERAPATYTPPHLAEKILGDTLKNTVPWRSRHAAPRQRKCPRNTVSRSRLASGASERPAFQ